MADVNGDCEINQHFHSSLESRETQLSTSSDSEIEAVQGLASCKVVKVTESEGNNLSEQITSVIKKGGSKISQTSRDTSFDDDFSDQENYSRTDFSDVLELILKFAAYKKDPDARISSPFILSDSESSLDGFTSVKSSLTKPMHASSPSLIYDEFSSSSSILTCQESPIDIWSENNSFSEECSVKNILDEDNQNTANSLLDVTLTADTNNNLVDKALLNQQFKNMNDISASSVKNKTEFIPSSDFESRQEDHLLVSTGPVIKETDFTTEICKDTKNYNLPFKKRIVFITKTEIPKDDKDQEVGSKINGCESTPTVQSKIEARLGQIQKSRETLQTMSVAANNIPPSNSKISEGIEQYTFVQLDAARKELPQAQQNNAASLSKKANSDKFPNPSKTKKGLNRTKRSSSENILDSRKLAKRSEEFLATEKLSGISSVIENFSRSDKKNQRTDKRRFSMEIYSGIKCETIEFRTQPFTDSVSSQRNRKLQKAEECGNNSVSSKLFLEKNSQGRPRINSETIKKNPSGNCNILSQAFDCLKTPQKPSRRHSIASGQIQKRGNQAFANAASNFNKQSATKIKPPPKSSEKNVIVANNLALQKLVEKQKQLNNSSVLRNPRKINDHQSVMNDTYFNKPNASKVSNNIASQKLIEKQNSLESNSTLKNPPTIINGHDLATQILNRIPYSYGKMVLAWFKNGMLPCNVLNLLSYQAGSTSVQFKKADIVVWDNINRIPSGSVLKFQEPAEAIKAHEELSLRYRQFVKTMPMADLLKTAANMEILHTELKSSILDIRSKKKQDVLPQTQEFEKCLKMYGDVKNVEYLSKKIGSEIHCEVKYSCVTQGLLAVVALDDSYLESVGRLQVQFKRTSVNETIVPKIISYIQNVLGAL